MQHVTIALSDEIMHHATVIANLTNEAIGTILAEKISTQLIMPSPDGDVQLADALNTLSDVQLWWLIRLGFSHRKLELLQTLTEQAKAAPLSPSQMQQQEKLLDEYDWYTLLRSAALVQLQTRGYDVQAYLRQNKPD